MRKRLVLSTVAVAITLSMAPAVTSAASSSDVATGSGITLTHTLFYNTTPCANHSNTTMYQYTSWKTAFHRTAGADREIDTVYYRTDAQGYLCSDPWAPRTTGLVSYHIAFGTLNDKTKTGSFSWPYLLLDGNEWSGSATRAYYTRRAGGPWVTNLCATVTFTSDVGCSRV